MNTFNWSDKWKWIKIIASPKLIFMNALTGKERALNAMLNKPTDRVSVHPAIDVCYASRASGKKVGDCFMDPVLHAKALENIFVIHPDIDGLYINLCMSPRSARGSRKSGNDSIILDNGGMTWRIPEDDVGTVSDHDITSLDDDRLRTVNPLQDGIIDTYRHVSQEIKEKYLIVPGLTGPFSQMVFMMGLSETLMSIFEQPEKLKQALEWRTQKALEWADQFIQMGAECVWIGEGAASGSLIAPETYEEFVLPYAARVVEHLRSFGIVTIMHVCGDISKSSGVIAKTGADAMDIDYMVDMYQARLNIGRPICLRGNLNPVDLLTMKYDELLVHCRKIISAGEYPFSLSTGCLVARDTPKENIDAMTAAAQAFSSKQEMN